MDGYARHLKANLLPEQAVEMQALDGLAEKPDGPDHPQDR